MFLFIFLRTQEICSRSAPDCDASETGDAAVQLDGPLPYHYAVVYAKPIYVKEFEACALAFI
jgi:hypothetical protein